MTWTPATESRLRELVDQRATAQQMAEALGVSRNMVISKLRRMGMKLVTRAERDAEVAAKNAAKLKGTSRPNMSPAQREAVIADWKSGMRVDLIAAKYGISNSHPARLAKQAGYTRDDRKRKAQKAVPAAPRKRIQPHNIQNKAVSRRTDPVFVERAAPVDAPVPLMLSLVDLNEQTCRFPIGDPKLSGFGFCGHETFDHGRYCSAHRRLAYLPLTEGLRQIKRTIKQAEAVA